MATQQWTNNREAAEQLIEFLTGKTVSPRKRSEENAVEYKIRIGSKTLRILCPSENSSICFEIRNSKGVFQGGAIVNRATEITYGEIKNVRDSTGQPLKHVTIRTADSAITISTLPTTTLTAILNRQQKQNRTSEL